MCKNESDLNAVRRRVAGWWQTSLIGKFTIEKMTKYDIIQENTELIFDFVRKTVWNSLDIPSGWW
jgi:hypothetical protein